MSQTKIPDALERIYLQRGWFNVYQRYIPDLQQPNHANEMYCRCPWRDINDANASMSVNAGNGLFNCFRTSRTGNYLQFRSWMDSSTIGPDGKIVPLDIRLVEEMAMREEGIVAPDESWFNQCHLALVQSIETVLRFQTYKPWFIGALSSLQIGYEWETGSIVIPIRDENAKLINARLYNPTGQPKMRWKVSGLTGNYLFPHTGYNETGPLILVEGETDVISLRGLGFNAISGTVGGTSPFPPGTWHRDRDVIVMTDEDSTGEKARQVCINSLRGLASEVKSARIPEWDERPSGADASDYIMYLLQQGMNMEQVRQVFLELFQNAEIVASRITQFDIEATPVPFSGVLEAEQVLQRLEFVGRISARSEKRYIGVTRYNLTCPTRGHNFCENCPMKQRHGGNMEFFLDRRSPDQLKLIGTNDMQRLQAIQKINGIPTACPSVDMTPMEWTGYEPTEIASSIAEAEHDNELNDSERYRREAYFIIQPDTHIEENRDYNFKGFLYPDPKTQAGVIVIDAADPLATTAEKFKMDDEIAETLKQFQPKNQNNLEFVIAKMNERANDLADSVTNIKGRTDLHLAMSLVWHSAIRFMIGKKKIARGWIELLIIGDTRSGKSVTFRSLCKHFDIGTWVDCKNTSTAGLLGSVNTSNMTGERYITSGILPQNDKGIVGLDEMEGARLDKVFILEALASMRSEGIVTITKAAQAQYRARVRKICMANPGKGLLIKETGKTGAQLIVEMIPQPENIARFDAALAVGQDDVLTETINTSVGLSEPIFNVEAQRTLLTWIYSRKTEQIQFTPEAEQRLKIASIQMCEKYDAALPVVEPSDQITRIAKWAVSIAGYLFSSANNHGEILVTEAHVHAAQTLLEYFYDKPVMGYNRFSLEKRQKRILEDEPEIRKAFDLLGMNKYKIASQLLKNDSISDRAFRNVVNGPAATTVLQSLIHNNCIGLRYNGKSDSYEKNPTFTQWLMQFVQEGAIK